MKQWVNSINWYRVLIITLVGYTAIANYSGDTVLWRVFNSFVGGAEMLIIAHLGLWAYQKDVE